MKENLSPATNQSMHDHHLFRVWRPAEWRSSHGFPLSPVIADIYMEFFEDMAIQDADLKPFLWLRYVDDTFVVWPHGADQLDGFLNSKRSSIQFTMELNEGSIPFLDVLVKRGVKRDEGVTTQVYWKPTHQPIREFQVTPSPQDHVKCLTLRAKEVCHPSTLQPELDHIQGT